MKKRHKDNMNLGDVLKKFVETNNLQKGLDKIDVQDAWKNLMGKGVNSYTTAVLLKNQTLYVKLSSSVLREELSYGKEKIINLLNDSLGKPLINKIVFQ